MAGSGAVAGRREGDVEVIEPGQVIRIDKVYNRCHVVAKCECHECMSQAAQAIAGEGGTAEREASSSTGGGAQRARKGRRRRRPWDERKGKVSNKSEPVWCIVDEERWQPRTRLIKDISNNEGVVRYRPKDKDTYEPWVRVARSKFLDRQAVTKPGDAGLGLYAARAFKKEDIVITYYGKKLGRAHEVGHVVRSLWAKGKGRHIIRLGGDVHGMETDAEGYIGGCMNCSLDLKEII